MGDMKDMENLKGENFNVKKVDVSKTRLYKAMLEKGTETVIFRIPITEDVKEKKEVLEKQVIENLIIHSNLLGSYQKAISKVEGYLKAMIKHYPEEESLIKEAADSADIAFLKLVDVSKQRSMQEKIKRGEMFIGVKNISGHF